MSYLFDNTDIISNYISSSGSFPISNINNFNFQLGRTQTGISDVIVVTMTPVNAGADVFTDLSWLEVI